MPEQMVATVSFTVVVDGEPLVVQRDVTLVDADDELVKRFPDRFRRAGSRPGVEAATAEPGEKRGQR